MLRHLARNPIVPLALIAGIVLFIGIRTELTESKINTPAAMLTPVGKDFDDARRVLTALKLMDESRLDDAATILQPISLSPMRLSSLISDVRDGSPTVRGALMTLLDDWILAKADTDDLKKTFPSQSTPTLVLDLSIDILNYQKTQPPLSRTPEQEKALATIFNRISIEKKLRLLETPTHL